MFYPVHGPAAVFRPSAVRIPAQTAGPADEPWLQELLAERQQKDVEFKTSATSPMAGSAAPDHHALRKKLSSRSRTGVSLSNPGAGEPERFFRFSPSRASGTGMMPPRTSPAAWASAPSSPLPTPLSPGSLFTAGRFTLAVYPGRRHPGPDRLRPAAPAVARFRTPALFCPRSPLTP